MNDSAADPLTEFRNVNVVGTTQLARDAAKAGVKRFVFISSIKVNGEESTAPYTAASLPAPSDPYGILPCPVALRDVEFLELPFFVGAIPAGRLCAQPVNIPAIATKGGRADGVAPTSLGTPYLIHNAIFPQTMNLDIRQPGILRFC